MPWRSLADLSPQRASTSELALVKLGAHPAGSALNRVWPSSPRSGLLTNWLCPPRSELAPAGRVWLIMGPLLLQPNLSSHRRTPLPPKCGIAGATRSPPLLPAPAPGVRNRGSVWAGWASGADRRRPLQSALGHPRISSILGRVLAPEDLPRRGAAPETLGLRWLPCHDTTCPPPLEGCRSGGASGYDGPGCEGLKCPPRSAGSEDNHFWIFLLQSQARWLPLQRLQTCIMGFPSGPLLGHGDWHPSGL